MIVNQEPIIKQPPVYIQEGPSFQSYDGGVHNYQNLIPVPKAQGIYTQEPLFHASRQEIGILPQSYVQQPLFVPKAAGIISQPAYTVPQEKYPEVYQQQVYQEPIGVKSYQDVPSYQISQPAIAYEQKLPAVSYQAPIEHSNIGYEERVAYQEPIPSNKIALPAYEGNIPVSSYQLEQAYGDPKGLIAAQPQYVAHPHGVSSQNYVGRTGNIHGDGEYVSYDEGVAYDDASYKQPLPYKYKRSSN